MSTHASTQARKFAVRGLAFRKSRPVTVFALKLHKRLGSRVAICSVFSMCRARPYGLGVPKGPGLALSLGTCAFRASKHARAELRSKPLKAYTPCLWARLGLTGLGGAKLQTCAYVPGFECHMSTSDVSKPLTQGSQLIPCY